MFMRKQVRMMTSRKIQLLILRLRISSFSLTVVDISTYYYILTLV